jgi:hypothetical protein
MPAWTISRIYTMSWGTREHGRIHLPVRDIESFRRGYDLADADADISGTLFEVELWDTALPLDRPMMVQFLVGHPTRSRVVIHNGGAAYYAVGDELPNERWLLHYERPSGGFVTEPESVTITPEQAQEVVAHFVQTGRASDRVGWVEDPME